MLEQMETDRIFTLAPDIKDPLQKKLFSMVKGPIEHVLAFPRLNKAYAEVSRMRDKRPFPDKVLELLDVAYDLNDGDIAKLPVSGPAIVVANHPYGGIEGVILASILRSIRSDVKFMANSLLACIPEMRELLIGVNPFKQDGAVRQNFKPLRETLQWVAGGGMLVVFPAGEVSHFDLRKGTITDPAWSPTIARLIRRTEAPVLPIFFLGTNSPAFHMAGMVHPLLRTAMLPNELLNKGRRKIRVRVGDLIPFQKLAGIEQDAEMMEYLRMRTYILEHRALKADAISNRPVRRKIPAAIMTRPIIPPQPPLVLAEEVSRLAPSQTLAESGDHMVIQARAEQIPHVLLEIGRLREVTFRAVGEGTGNAVDLDGFDQTYLHLFIWNRGKHEVVGAYRIGLTDELAKQQGVRGIYTSTLFQYDGEFLKRLGPALELGRSFVRPEYQRSYAPLLLLWKGIGRYIVDNPHYRTLFGPVSITDEYQALSRQLIVRFLKMNRYRNDMAELVKARRPVRIRPLKDWDMEIAMRCAKDDIEDISGLIASIESDRKGIPILLKQYLKLGGRIIGFNVDPAFGNVVDGLIMVDLAETEPKMLERYLGKEGSQQFLAYHRAMRSENHEHCA